MPGGLWAPGAVWEFRQNVRTLPTTGVRVVQSSSEPSTWQWEYTIQPEDEPLVDTVGRGDVPPDMLYGCLLNFWFLNNSGGARNYNCRVEVQSQTLGTFQSGAASRSSVPNNNYVYFTPLIHSVGIGTTLRARFWGTAAHSLESIRLILVPMVTPPVSDVLLLVETLTFSPTSNVALVSAVHGTSSWTLNTFSIGTVANLTRSNACLPLLLLPLSTSWVGGMIDWLENIAKNARTIGIFVNHTTILYSNGYRGVYDITMHLLDVRFGHLFRNLAGVSKF